MIKFETFKEEDLDTLAKEAIDPDVAQKLKLWKEYKDIILKSGFTQSGYLNGELVCVAGMIYLENQQGELWAVFSKKLINHKKTLLQSLRSVLFKYILPTSGIKKVMVLGKNGFRQSQTLLKHLGFTQCGVFQNDYYIYERLI